jgi:hypothetical protein
MEKDFNNYIVPIADLTESDRLDILSRYGNRDTLDSPWNDTARLLVGKGPATETDEQWINNRIWVQAPNGKIVFEASR